MSQSPSTPGTPEESPKANPPEILVVSLDQMLVVPEDNPRGAYPQQDVLDMARTLKQSGQEDPILLRRRTPEERAQAHPDIPYRLVGGFLRVAAAPLAGLAALEAIVRDMTPQKALQAAILDNVRKDMNWLAWAQSADSLIKDGMKLQEASDALAKDASWVGKLLKLLSLLDFPTRQLISENFRKKDGYDLPESHAHCLEDLATGGPNDQVLIGNAIRVVIDRQMPFELVKKLVEWIQKGNSPESFPQDGKTEVKKGVKNQRFDPADPLAKLWQDLPRTIKVRPTPKGYKAVLALSKDEAVLALYGALGTVEEAKRLQGQPHDPRFAAALADLIPGGRPGGILNASFPASPASLGLGSWLKGVWAAWMGSLKAGGPKTPADSPQSSVDSTPNPGTMEKTIWELLAGIPITAKIRAKVKKGERPTFWEVLILLLAILGMFLGLLGKYLWKFAQGGWRLAKTFLGKAFRLLGEVVGKPAKKITQGVVGIALVVGLAYGLYLFFFHPAGLRGLLSRTASGAIHWVGSWVNPWEGDTHTDSPKESVQSSHGPQPEVSAQMKPESVPTPGLKPPVSDQALAVPISKSDMGTPVPTPEVFKTKRLKLKTSKSLKKSIPVAVVSTQNSTPKTENAAPSGQSQLDLLNQINAESKTAQAFAQAFYAADYNDLLGRRTKLNKYLRPGYSGAFFKAFPTGLKIKEIGEHKLVESFKPSGDAKLLRSDDQSEEFQVEGTLVTRSEMDITDPVTTQKPAGLVIDLSREPESKGLVTGVREMVFPGKKVSPEIQGPGQHLTL